MNAIMLHADRTGAQREQALEEFKNGKRDILVATGAICRGLGV